MKSRGIAIVQYAKKEDAAEALKKLPYVYKLGEPGRISILFYESKESRMQLTEQRQRAMSKTRKTFNLENLNPQVQSLINSDIV